MEWAESDLYNYVNKKIEKNSKIEEREMQRIIA